MKLVRPFTDRAKEGNNLDCFGEIERKFTARPLNYFMIYLFNKYPSAITEVNFKSTVPL